MPGRREREILSEFLELGFRFCLHYFVLDFDIEAGTHDFHISVTVHE